MHVEATNKNAFPNHGLDNYFFTTPALRLRLDVVQEHIRRGEAPVLLSLIHISEPTRPY